MKTELTMIVLMTTLTLTSRGQSTDQIKVCRSADNAFIKLLEERQIGKSKYSILLPQDYAINEAHGEDFSLYYFYPADTTKHAGFSGGVYFGNHPSQFPAKSASCSTEKLKSEMLDQNVNLTRIYRNSGEYLFTQRSFY